MRTLLCLLCVTFGSALAQERPTLTVTVTWDGELPKLKPVVIPDGFRQRNPDEARFCETCGGKGSLDDESVVVDARSRGLRDVAVSLVGVPDDLKRDLPPPVLDYNDCRFEPRVQFVVLGSSIRVKNSDAFVHNARILGRGNRELWNALVPAEDGVDTTPLRAPGVYSVFCDVHPWMRAWLIGTRTPWVGVSDARGRVTFEGIPAGTEVTVHLWHPTLGRAQVRSVVAEGGTELKPLTQKDFKN
jgi:hypothetical protein